MSLSAQGEKWGEVVRSGVIEGVGQVTAEHLCLELVFKARVRSHLGRVDGLACMPLLSSHSILSCSEKTCHETSRDKHVPKKM